MTIHNLFDNLDFAVAEEVFTPLLEGKDVRLERIVSAGQATPAGEWYDQDEHEWVVLLRGRAGLVFHGEPEVHVLEPGDYVNIPAHTLHRVAWTDETEKTVWLALHYCDQLLATGH
jgi:cupin 2 domain-containing protein